MRCIAFRPSVTERYLATNFVDCMASSLRISALVVLVLSRSTTPTGISIGSPSSISDVKKNIVPKGKSSMQNQYMWFRLMIWSSRSAIL